MLMVAEYTLCLAQVTQISSGQRLEDSPGGQEAVVTVEHLIAIVKSMPPEEAGMLALAGVSFASLYLFALSPRLAATMR